MGLAALAITDRNTFAGVVRAHGAAKDMELRFVVGVRLVVVEEHWQLFAWPTTRAAYGRLCRLLSLGQQRAEKGECILTLEDVYDHAEGSIFALPQAHIDQLADIKTAAEGAALSGPVLPL